MKDAAQSYRAKLRKAFRRLRVPMEHEALSDLDEFLAGEFDRRPPSYGSIVEGFGPPEAVARSYLDLAVEAEAGKPPPKSWLHHAPGWKLTCVSCGRTKDADRVGPFCVRAGARSVGKYIPGYCRGCRWLRFIRVWRFAPRVERGRAPAQRPCVTGAGFSSCRKTQMA